MTQIIDRISRVFRMSRVVSRLRSLLEKLRKVYRIEHTNDNVLTPELREELRKLNVID